MSLEYAWSQIEPATAIVCASIITYRPLIIRLMEYLMGLSSKLLSNRNSQVTMSSNWTGDGDSVGYKQLPKGSNSLGLEYLPRPPEPARTAKGDLSV